MIFFSGFLFQNEYSLFEKYINNSLELKSDFVITGFSFGAIKALETSLQKISNGERVDKLQLISPPFFYNRDKSFIRTQIYYFNNKREDYINNFLKNAFFPAPHRRDFLAEGNVEQLHKLLSFKWNREILMKLIEKGVKIEVYIGSEDLIIDSREAFLFFRDFARTCFIKNVGHVLV